MDFSKKAVVFSGPHQVLVVKMCVITVLWVEQQRERLASSLQKPFDLNRVR